MVFDVEELDDGADDDEDTVARVSSEANAVNVSAAPAVDLVDVRTPREAVTTPTSRQRC